jgi:menaquinone-dependent protoporphyrinogen oxidase
MKRILVSYATRAGSTVGAAETIAESLGAAGHQVDIRPVKDVSDMNNYDALVIGSAVHMGNWLPEAVDFVKKNRSRLSQVPTAFFTVHMLNLGDSEASRQARLKYTAPVRALVTPKAEVFFAGKMDYAKLSFFDRMIALLVAKLTGSKEGDYRDWAAIRSWAVSLPQTLGVAAS